MQEDGKNRPQEQELDRFWDIQSLMPKSRRGQGIPVHHQLPELAQTHVH